MSRRSPTPIWQQPAFLAGVGLAGFLLWRISTSDADREFSLVAGRTYEFTLVAHPYGDATEWWTAAREALIESGASLVTESAAGQGQVQIRFSKASPVTATLLPHTVLYPNTPELATATLLSAKPSTSISVSGSNATAVISGGPKREHDRAAHYERMARDCEADARNPQLSGEQELNLELAKEYRARARRHREGNHS